MNLSIGNAGAAFLVDQGPSRPPNEDRARVQSRIRRDLGKFSAARHCVQVEGKDPARYARLQRLFFI